MNILFILENYYPNIGGVETLFKSLCEALAKSGHKITVYTNKFDSTLKSKEEINGVKIIRAPFGNRYLFTFFGWLGAIKYSKGVNFIHTTSYNAAVPAFIAGVLRRKKVIITFHEVWGKLWFTLPYMNKFSLFLHYSFEQLLLKLPFHRFIGVSNTTSSRLKESGVNPSKIHTILNGIDYSLIDSQYQTPNENESYSFTFFGRLGISKGLDLLIPAFDLLQQENKKVKLNLIIPTTPEAFHNRIVSELNKRSLSEHVQVYSNLDTNRLNQLIANSNAVVIPSYSEGFCFAAVETMAIGTPIIATDKGALNEVINGKHIFITDLTVDAVKDGLSKAINGNWSYKSPIQYHLTDSIISYLKLYKQI